MLYQPTIKKMSQQTNPCRNHQLLFELGLEHVRRLSRRIWTDYNLHDPGITTLELLCYALTDLSYRASLPVKELLAVEEKSAGENAGQMREQFFTPARILPNRPLTLLDYRKLLIDLPGVRNAWLEPAPLSYYADTSRGELLQGDPKRSEVSELKIRGLYRVTIDYESENEQERKEVRAGVEARLQKNRNLCEDFVGIGDLETQRFNLCCAVELTPGADAARVQAGILAGVEEYLDPPVRSYGLSEMLEREKPDRSRYRMEEIFDGPLLDCGFIDDAELAKAELRKEIRLSDLVSIIMDILGVRAVREIAVSQLVAGGPAAAEKSWLLRVEDSKKPALGKARLSFYQGSIPVPVDSRAAARAYLELKEEGRQQVETPRESDLEIPLGSFRDIGGYFSFQNHFPAIYGLGPEGLGGAADQKRRALALQLKGYLLFFDQVMADYLAQLSRVRELFSSDPELQRSYFHQAVDSFRDFGKIYRVEEMLDSVLEEESDREMVEMVASYLRDDLSEAGQVRFRELLAPFAAGAASSKLPDLCLGFLQSRIRVEGSPEFGRALQRLLAKEKRTRDDLFQLLVAASLERRGKEGDSLERRNRFLDHLIARFAERFHDAAQLLHADPGAGPAQLISCKCDFLRSYPEISSGRSLGYNHALAEESDPWNSSNVSGLEKRLAALLGTGDYTRRSLAPAGYDIYAEVDATPGDEFRFRICNRDKQQILLSSATRYRTREQAEEEMGKAIRLGRLESSYRVKRSVVGKYFFNVVDQGGQVKARRIQYFRSREQMEQAMAETRDCLSRLQAGEGMYLIENILLRPQQKTDPFFPICPSLPEFAADGSDPYSYRLHILLPSYGGRFGKPDFRQYAEEVIRSETPAHILPKICWLNEADMALVEGAYRRWIELAAGKAKAEREAIMLRIIYALFGVKNVYPTGKIEGSGAVGEENTFILDRTRLGTQKKGP